jgi:hypothetical protein
LRFHRRRHPVVSTRNFYWTGTGWYENSTRWKSCKPVRARGGGAWACLAHALQCLYDGRACCSPRALQIIRNLVFIGDTKCTADSTRGPIANQWYSKSQEHNTSAPQKHGWLYTIDLFFYILLLHCMLLNSNFSFIS